MNSAPAPAPAPASGLPKRSSVPVRPGPGRGPQRYDRGGHRPLSRGASRPGSASRRIQRILRRPTSNTIRVDRTADYLTEPARPTSVLIITLGGVEEVGRNLTAIEIGAPGDILVFDPGFHFVPDDT